jgi:hypothetical protein
MAFNITAKIVLWFAKVRALRDSAELRSVPGYITEQ